MASTFRGLLGEKLGMTQVFDENNRLVPVTVVKAGPCVVTQVRTPEVDGYSAVQLGFGEIDPRKVNRPEGGHFTKAGVPPRRHLVELRTEDAGDYTVGQELTADVFDGVAKVDAERGLLLIKGAVPGPKGGLLLVRSAVKGGPVGSDKK